MKVEIMERKPGIYVLHIDGDVDMSNSPNVRKVLVPTFEKGPSHIIVDLSGVSYIDSSGIATIVEGLQLSRKSGVRLTLAGMGSTVEAVFELAYLKDVFEIVPDVEQLLQ